MTRSILASLALLLPLATVSCRSSFIGRDAGAMSVNTVSRTYAKPAADVWSAVLAAMKELDLTIDSDRHDALGGELKAQRANRDQVLVEVRPAESQAMQVSIAVDPGDRTIAQIIQEKIADKLGMSSGAGRTGVVAGSSVEATYDRKLEECRTAARKSSEALKLGDMREETHDTWARIDSRHSDVLPIAIRMERTLQDQTRVTFSAGTTPADDNRLLATRLKTEFERQLPQTP